MSRPTRKQATKKSLYLKKVEQAGKLGASVEEFILDNAMTEVERIVGDFVLRIHNNINKEKGMVTTGAIADIEVVSKDNSVQVIANNHLIYQDRGVNGSEVKKYKTPHSYTDKMPPVDVFKEYIKRKNINLRDNKKYYGKESPFKDLTDEQLIERAAYGMARKIFKEGFKPRNIYSKEIPKLMEELERVVPDMVVQAITQVIEVKPNAKRIITK